MGRGGQKPDTGAAKTLTWDEIKTHDSKTDRWMVIEGQVYDVTKWSNKHPGGSRLLGHYAGQDATVSVETDQSAALNSNSNQSDA